MGAMMAMCGAIFVKRGKKGTKAMLLEEGQKCLNDGLSIGIFPQGTRQIPRPNTPLKPFRIGAFSLAVETKAKIVPMTILYPSDFMSAKQSSPGFKLVVHPGVEPGTDPEALMQKVEDMCLGPVLKEHPLSQGPSNAKGDGKDEVKKDK